MAETEKHPAAEALETGAQAAQFVRGAVKTGKALAGAAKGAAAGGPYGAVLGFAWENRKLVGSIIIGATALLMLPIVILCMLPSVMFGGVGEAYAPGDPNTPILNSSTVILESANAICQSVDAILSEALNKVLRDIEKDFQRSDVTEMELINPFEGTVAFDAATLVSMYCASKDGTLSEISVKDLEKLLRRYQGRMFSYGWEDKTKVILTVDPETGELISQTEVCREYTVTYHGDDVFSEVFSLTEEQKALAKDYASNLNLFLLDSPFADSIPGVFRKNVRIDISGYHDPTIKNNLDLVVWAQEAEKNRWGYVLGTFGHVLDSDLFAYKLKQYPDGVGKYASFITANWLGGRSADCVGLIKGYCWLNIETLEVGYQTNDMPDIDEGAMFRYAREKGTIDTIPEIPGLGVWFDGHIGIYIGNGEVIEAKGTMYGVVRTQLARGSWTHWLKIPYITYITDHP